MEDNNIKDIFLNNDVPTPQKKKLSKVAIALIVVACVLAITVTFVFGYVLGSNSGINGDLPLMIEAYQYIKKYYYKDISWNEFQEIATAAFAGSLDQFSGMVSVDDGNSQAGTFGIYMSSTVYNQHDITFIVPGTPNYNAVAKYKYDDDMVLVEDFDASSENVQMREGDRIFAIGLDNSKLIQVESASSQLLTQTLNTVIGDQKVIFVFQKYDGKDENGKDKYKEGYYGIELSRTFSENASKQAFYYPYQDNVGIIKLLEFSSDANYDFEECIEQFVADGKTKLILDLRNNGGGDATSLQFIAQYLIKNPSEKSLPLIKLVSNSGDGKMVENIEYSSTEGGNNPSYSLYNKIDGFEVVVLANSNSASASEALIGALQYYNDTKIVGTTTFGKGVAQRVFTLSNGDYLYVTNGTYYVPTNDAQGNLVWERCIHGVGFTPEEENICTAKVSSYDTDACTKRATELFSK